MKNANLINSAYMALALSGVNASGMGYLKNPFKVPQQVILKGDVAAAATNTYFFIDDACGLALTTGKVVAGDAAGKAFTTVGVSIANIKEFLKTHCLIVGGYNFNSSDAAQLTNNLETIFTSLDSNSDVNQLFSSLSVSNMQYNQNLLNVDQPFVYTNQTALKILVTPSADNAIAFTFTLKIAAAVPYGKLDEFLEFEQIPARSRQSC